MFVCTYEEEKRDMLLKQGFRLLFNQYRGDKKVYVFELKPTLYSTFSEDDKNGLFLSNKMYMV